MAFSSQVWRRHTAAVAALLIGLAACTGNAPIPSAAQQVQITIGDGAVELDPDTVPSGDVYLVLDDGAISFVERKAGPDGSPEPLDDAQIAQILQGNLQDTSLSGLEATNCDPQQRADARGQTGPCGNVMLVKVQPGSYLIVAGAADEPGQPSAVLTVKRTSLPP